MNTLLSVSLLLIVSLTADMVSGAKKKEERTDSQTQPYRFQYQVDNPDDGHQFRQEEGSGWGAKGAYGYRKPNGDFRVVDYLADEYGFNARIKTNEQGATPASSADVQVRADGDYEVPAALSSRSSSVKGGSDSLPIEQKPEKPEKLIQEPESVSITTTSSAPSTSPPPKVLLSGPREVERDASVFVKPVKPSRKATIANKISIHQLISEAMPSLQMSVTPVYFVNKHTKSVMAIPYLVMKSVSKMPLLPGMFDGLNGLGQSQNLLNFQHTPARVQRYRSGNDLHPLLGSQSDRPSHLEAENNGLEVEQEAEAASAWMPMRSNNQESQYEQHPGQSWWRKK